MNIKEFAEYILEKDAVIMDILHKSEKNDLVQWIWLYTRSHPPCPYCTRVKELLNIYGYDFYEKDIATNETYMKEFQEQGFRTVPQVFLEDTRIGGFDDLKQWVREDYTKALPIKKRAEHLKELNDNDDV